MHRMRASSVTRRDRYASLVLRGLSGVPSDRTTSACAATVVA